MNTTIVTLNRLGALFVNHAGSMFLQAGILIALLWTLDNILRRRLRASLRYGLWMLILVKLVLPPGFSLPTGVGNLGPVANHTAAILPVQVEGLSPSHVEGVTSSVQDPSASAHGQAIRQTRSQNALQAGQGYDRVSENTSVRLSGSGVILVAWLVGLAILLAALLIRAVCVRRILRHAKTPSESLLALLAQCRQEVGLTTSVELKLTDCLSGPAVCRVRRPVILVPQALTDGLPEDKQRAILTHELCHIKRADPWVNLAQTLLQVFYFYNPLVWLANVSIRRVREQAVDESVLVCLKGQLQCYSHTLIDIASVMRLRMRLGMGLIGVAESKTQLNERIQLMLHRPIPRRAGLGYSGLAILIVLGCTLLPMATVHGRANAVAGAFAPADAQTTQKVSQDIQTTADEIVAAFNAKQLDAVMSHYDSDVIVMGPGEPALVGSKAQRDAFAKNMGQNVRVSSLKLPQDRIVVCGDLIYMGGPYAYTVQSPDGSTTNTDWRCGVMVAQRQSDGTLKLKLEAYNRMASPPASGMAAPEVFQCTAKSPTLPADAKLYDQIRDLDRQVEKMFSEKNYDGAMGQYADDAVLMANGGQIIQGRAAIKTLCETADGSDNMRDTELKFAHVEGNDQMVYVVKWCGWEIKNPVSGLNYTIPGKSLHVWQRQADGSWKILLDLNNVDIML